MVPKQLFSSNSNTFKGLGRLIETNICSNTEKSQT